MKYKSLMNLFLGRIPALFLVLVLCLPCFWGVSLAHAADAPLLAEDPVVEQRLVKIAEELRCLVCQNESLAGSRADLAVDLRREVRTLIKAGKSDQAIRDFLVSRYGDFVLYKPPLKPTTWLLWFGPVLLLALAVWFLMRTIRQTRSTAASPELDADQRARAQALLSTHEVSQ